MSTSYTLKRGVTLYTKYDADTYPELNNWLIHIHKHKEFAIAATVQHVHIADNRSYGKMYIVLTKQCALSLYLSEFPDALMQQAKTVKLKINIDTMGNLFNDVAPQDVLKVVLCVKLLDAALESPPEVGKRIWCQLARSEYENYPLEGNHGVSFKTKSWAE